MIGMPPSHPPDYEAFSDWSDPYRTCEKTCNHDLARGVLVREIVGPVDGPYTGLFSKLHLSRRTAEYRDVDPTPIVTQLLVPPSTQRQQQEGEEEHEGTS